MFWWFLSSYAWLESPHGDLDRIVALLASFFSRGGRFNETIRGGGTDSNVWRVIAQKSKA